MKLTNNISLNTFKGQVQNCRDLEYAVPKAIEDADKNYERSIQFFNTLKMVNKDKTDNKLIIKDSRWVNIQNPKNAGSFYRRYNDVELEYGDYKKVVKTDLNNLGNDIIDAVVDFGKHTYGAAKISQPSEVMEQAIFNKMSAELMNNQANREFRTEFNRMADRYITDFVEGENV